MVSKWFLYAALVSILVLNEITINASKLKGYNRDICKLHKEKMKRPVSEFKKRLYALRDQMFIRATLQGPEIDAYILPSTDEHLNEEVADRDQRLKYLTGFSGTNAVAAITHRGAAIWVENRYAEQANGELDCDWDIFISNGLVTISDWLRTQLHLNSRIGADPHVISHYLWRAWKADLENHFLEIVRVNTNLIDLIWNKDRPAAENHTIQVQGQSFAGEKWEDKIIELRKRLKHLKCDAMVITSLTEIAYILNIRGNDIPYTPVVKSYLIVSHEDIFFYVDRIKISLGIDLHLSTDCYKKICVKIREYHQIWNDIRTQAQIWKRVLVPGPCVQELGASEAIFSSMPEKIIFEHVSPIIFMRAKKNSVEQQGMRIAHIKDGAAVCEALSNLESRFYSEQWSEEKIKYEIDRSRILQKHSKGLSLRTVVAFGKHSALPNYLSSGITNINVTDESLLVIESGGQYFEGTTDVSRTFIFGEPTTEMKQAYTNVLAGILRLSQLNFPSDLKTSEVDALVRSQVWNSMINYSTDENNLTGSSPYLDYLHARGHGIGAYGAVEEPPISIAYSMESLYNFKAGYFFSTESGLYKQNEFGVRLKNVFEVVDTQRVHPSGVNFLAFQDVTLVPYDSKLIDGSLLSAVEKRWLNKYNSKIRNAVGEELKRQGNMQAFYWMMNKTRHIREYYPEDEYRLTKNGVAVAKIHFNIRHLLITSCLIELIVYLC